MEFEGFCGALAHACETAQADTRMIVAMNDEQPDDPYAVLLGEIAERDLTPALTAQLDQLVKGRQMLGLATRVAWSPDEGDATPAWFLVAVTGADEARFAVKRIAEDDRWWRLRGPDAPWFGLSTAGSLRASLLRGEPLHLKSVDSNALLKRPFEEPNPPADEHGRL